MFISAESNESKLSRPGFSRNVFEQLSPCNERAILDQLAGYFSRRLAGYRTSLVEDIEVVSIANC